MLTLADMRHIARGRIAEAAILIRAGRHDTAFYLCGYAVEVSLKARVCRTLGWSEFPSEPKDWQRYHAPLKVHDFELSAKWSGHAVLLDGSSHRRHWLEVNKWNPEMRYKPLGTTSRAQALAMLRSARVVSGLLNPR